MTHRLVIETEGPGLYELTNELQTLARGDGVMNVFVRHTSASLLVQENADPSVQADLLEFFRNRILRSVSRPNCGGS